MRDLMSETSRKVRQWHAGGVETEKMHARQLSAIQLLPPESISLKCRSWWENDRQAAAHKNVKFLKRPRNLVMRRLERNSNYEKCGSERNETKNQTDFRCR